NDTHCRTTVAGNAGKSAAPLHGAANKAEILRRLPLDWDRHQVLYTKKRSAVSGQCVPRWRQRWRGRIGIFDVSKERETMQVLDAKCRCAVIAAISLTLAACGQRASPTAVAEAYTPGLGELMTLQQMRHAKLWLAGQAGNWELASYELDELDEG